METLIRYHVSRTTPDGKQTLVEGGRFGYCEKRFAEEEAAKYNADERDLAFTERRPVREVFGVVKATTTFEEEKA